ncbi:hypothetical protein Tco_0368729 [Tanacetum coccineum]
MTQNAMDIQGGYKVCKGSAWKGVIRFGKRGKLSPRYIGPFKIIERIWSLGKKMELPENTVNSVNTFHVSNLKKCLADENLVIPLEEIQLDDKLHFIEEPVEIMDREVKQLKQSQIPIVKILETTVDKFIAWFGVDVSLDSGFPLNGGKELVRRWNEAKVMGKGKLKNGSKNEEQGGAGGGKEGMGELNGNGARQVGKWNVGFDAFPPAS